MKTKLEKLQLVCESLKYSGGWHALTQANPRSLTSWIIVNRLKSLGLEFGTVLDAGANVGQFARAAESCFPAAKVISFEPLPDLAEKLAKNLADCGRHVVMQTALGSHDGTVTFYRNSFDQSSSVLPMLEHHGGLMEGKHEVEKLQVPIARLDTALAGKELPGPVLLKMDLQGHELEALRGGETILTQCSHVLVETVFEQEYEGEPLFEELWTWLIRRGFSFERPLNFSHGKSGRIVQMDALFARRTSESQD